MEDKMNISSSDFEDYLDRIIKGFKTLNELCDVLGMGETSLDDLGSVAMDILISIFEKDRIENSDVDPFISTYVFGKLDGETVIQLEDYDHKQYSVFTGNDLYKVLIATMK